MRTSFLLSLVLVLTACGGGGGGGSASHGTPRNFTRNDGAVTSTFNPLSNNYTATQVVTISNDDAGASHGVVNLGADAATITSTTHASGYQIQVTLTATAPSDAQARAALATMSVSHRDATDPGVLYLDNYVSVPSYPASNGVSRSATVAAALPQSLAYDLSQHIGGGVLGSTGLSGTSVDFDAGGGDESLGGTWDSATLSSGGGTITVTADAASLSASTGGGSIAATLPSLRATTASFSVGGGTIDATVSHAGNGVFDADAQSDSGGATVAIAGTSPVGTQTGTHQHYRSSNYDTANPKIAVSAHGGGGTVSIHD